MAPSKLPLAAVREGPEPTHPCMRCGRDVTMDRALCEVCNPLDLAQPSATQVHGIAALGILVFVGILAVLGRAALSGTGPFVGAVTSVSPASGGLAVTLVVTNQGTKAAATTCRIVETPANAGGHLQMIQTPLVPAGSEVRFTTKVTQFGSDAIALVAECQSP